jgi:general stress protein 26
MTKGIGVCMLLTKGKDDTEEVRPMAVADVDDEGSIWFLASKSSEKIKSLRYDERAHLVFAHPGKEMYLDIKGSAEVVENKETIKRIWTPLAKAWFPGGADDPDICAINIRPEAGFYWDTQHGKVVELLKIISTVVTGKKSGDGVSGKIAVH